MTPRGRSMTVVIARMSAFWADSRLNGRDDGGRPMGLDVARTEQCALPASAAISAGTCKRCQPRCRQLEGILEGI
jgi:hypothetical protein